MNAPQQERGSKYAQVILDFLRGTPKGEVSKDQAFPGIKYRQQKVRSWGFLIKNGYVEETSTSYRLTRRYLPGLQKGPRLVILKETRRWTENEGDPKKPGFVHYEEKRTIGAFPHATLRTHVRLPDSVTQRRINESFNQTFSKKISKNPKDRNANR